MSNIVVREFNIPLEHLGKAFQGYRILQISDIHLGRGNHEGAILATISRLSVDLVALTGDIIHRPEQFTLARPFLEKLARVIHPADGIFGVWGNHDKTVTEKAVEGVPIRWLHNEAVQIRRGEDTVNLIGVNQRSYEASDLVRALGRITIDAPKILLAHYPSTAYWFNGTIDLVLAGHTHAGQIKIPGLPYHPNDQIPWQQAHGHSVLGKTHLVVSGGIGASGPLPLRMFSPTEISIVRLQ